MSLYEALGREEGIRLLVDRFYHHMDTDPTVADIRRMHPPDLTESREKLWMFLVGWTGGPQIYMERRGHPRLRARHMPFPIDETARDQWLGCMYAALDDCKVPEDVRSALWSAIARLADHMRNQDT